ncbi:hypothetical protein, conserved [Entamoeba dispar SAW760]|uniref:TBC1 domain family member 23 n=1 Tax=Entamoeba dispar (strain ATCC PRA-260 / SAW760) TaxID=370354 RepID=B0E7W9_ENTDS|nr:uncharacterized protein EDI_012310 [Entamoeba dispar SAW760]EDR29359.1 hypothetical protein, conserved [Entamoeba dispar SAW760]|eukprot:EDR29359.1 hypothetical protein, conserved [Entamoeba dispar SAW760]
MNYSQPILSLFQNTIEEKDTAMLQQLCLHFGLVDTMRAEIWKILLDIKPIKLPNHLNLTIVEADVPPLVNKLISVIGQSKRTELIKDSYSIATTLIQPKTSPNFIPTVIVALVFNYLYPKETIEFRLGGVFSFLNMLQPYFTHLYPSIQKGLFCLMHILLQYHDPQLCHCLDSFRVEPVLYTNRFLYNVLFSTGETLNDVLLLWDEFILNSNKYLFYYAVVAYLIQIKDDIMKETKKNELITLLKVKRISSEDLRIVICRAASLERRTLTSFKLLLSSCFRNEAMFQRWYSQSLGSTLALPVEPHSLVNDIKNGMEVLFIDCRTQEMYRGGNIGNAVNFDYTKREDEKYVSKFFQSKPLQCLRDPKKYIHVVIYGCGEIGKTLQQTPSLSELTMIMLDFIKRGIKRLGVLLSGYHLYHKLAMNKTPGFEVINHIPSVCPLCTPPELAKLTMKITEGTKKFTEKATIFFSNLSHQSNNSQAPPSPQRGSQSTVHKPYSPIQQNQTITPVKSNTEIKERQQMRVSSTKGTNQISGLVEPVQPISNQPIPNLLDLGLEPVTDPSSSTSSNTNSLNSSVNATQNNTIPIQPLPNILDMPIKPLNIDTSAMSNGDISQRLTFDEEYNEEDEAEESNYFDELMKESPTFEADYNVASGDAVDCWKKCLVILSSVDMLVAEKPSGDGEMFLLEEVTYTDIEKVSAKKQNPEICTIEVNGKQIILKVQNNIEFLKQLNDKMND